MPVIEEGVHQATPEQADLQIRIQLAWPLRLVPGLVLTQGHPGGRGQPTNIKRYHISCFLYPAALQVQTAKLGGCMLFWCGNKAV